MTGIPALSSGPELWYAVHNHRPEPLQLHAGQSIGVLEVVHLAETSASAPPSSPHPPSTCQPALPENLSPLQQQQLNELFNEFQDVFSQGDNDQVNTPLLQHGIETSAPLSANLTGGRTQQFVGKRWRRSSRCCPATLFDPRTVHGLSSSHGKEEGR